MFSKHGGSVYEILSQPAPFVWGDSSEPVASPPSKLTDRHRVAGFSCDTSDTLPDCWGRVFEVDGDGTEVARLTVPTTTPYFIGGFYRAAPWPTIAGEQRIEL